MMSYHGINKRVTSKVAFTSLQSLAKASLRAMEDTEPESANSSDKSQKKKRVLEDKGMSHFLISIN